MSDSILPEADREWLINLFHTEVGKIHEETNKIYSAISRLDGRLDKLEERQSEAERISLKADYDIQSRLYDLSHAKEAGSVAGKAAADASGKKWAAIATLASFIVGVVQHCQQQAIVPPPKENSAKVEIRATP